MQGTVFCAQEVHTAPNTMVIIVFKVAVKSILFLSYGVFFTFLSINSTKISQLIAQKIEEP